MASRSTSGRGVQSELLDQDNYVREDSDFAFLNQAGSPDPETAYWWVRRNGSGFGLFSFVEQIDADFLKRHNYNADGSMYKAVGVPANLAPDPTPAQYRKVTNKTSWRTTSRISSRCRTTCSTGWMHRRPSDGSTLDSAACRLPNSSCALTPPFPVDFCGSKFVGGERGGGERTEEGGLLSRGGAFTLWV